MYRNDSRLEKEENIEEYLDNLINTAFCEIQYICETHFNVLIDKNDMVVMDSSTNEKISYHLIFNIHFEHFNKLRLFVKTFFIDENRLTEFDMECYKCAVRNFRMVGCTKRGKNAFLKILSNNTDLDCMICHIPKSCKYIDITPRVIKKIKSIVPLIHNEERNRDLNTIVLEHLHLFVNESDDYCDWVAFGIALQKANLPIETFLEFQN